MNIIKNKTIFQKTPSPNTSKIDASDSGNTVTPIKISTDDIPKVATHIPKMTLNTSYMNLPQEAIKNISGGTKSIHISIKEQISKMPLQT